MKTHFFMFTNIYNVWYLLKHNFCFRLTITYSVEHFKQNTIYIIFDTCKCIQWLLLLQLKTIILMNVKMYKM